MNILRILFGSLVSGIVRLLVGVGILVAAYLLIVKPVLHTADNAIGGASKSLEGSGLQQIGKTLESVDEQVERQIRQAFHTAQHNGHPKRLIRCIKHAHGNVHRIERCTARY